MLFTPEQFIILGAMLIAGFVLGFAARPSTRKWKRRVREQSDSFTAYHNDAEDRIRAAKDRAAALEAEATALRADRAEAERTITALKAAALPAPVAAPVAMAPRAEPRLVTEVESPTARAEEDEPELTREEDAGGPDEAAPLRAVPVVQAAARPAFGKDPDRAEESAVEHVPMTPTPSAGSPAPIGPAEAEMPAKGWFGNSGRDDLTRLRGIDDALNTRLFGLGLLRFEDIEKLSAEDEMALEERLVIPAGYVAREQWRAQAALLRAGRDDEHAERFGAAEPATA